MIKKHAILTLAIIGYSFLVTANVGADQADKPIFADKSSGTIDSQENPSEKLIPDNHNQELQVTAPTELDDCGAGKLASVALLSNSKPSQNAGAGSGGKKSSQREISSINPKDLKRVAVTAAYASAIGHPCVY